jgi:hypothetical protein
MSVSAAFSTDRFTDSHLAGRRRRVVELALVGAAVWLAATVLTYFTPGFGTVDERPLFLGLTQYDAAKVLFMTPLAALPAVLVLGGRTRGVIGRAAAALAVASLALMALSSTVGYWLYPPGSYTPVPTPGWAGNVDGWAIGIGALAVFPAALGLLVLLGTLVWERRLPRWALGLALLVPFAVLMAFHAIQNPVPALAWAGLAVAVWGLRET